MRISHRMSSFTFLIGASAVALCTAQASAQTAQQSSDVGSSENTSAAAGADIVVTGTRASLDRALDLKKDQISVVDSISAEDIGKFPDQNVAESLQRIPGVSIDRSAGEGRSVTVRGFGPQFNTVLLNNRLLATENSGREFSFDVLPSDLISAAEVYKSSTAEQQDGGIGSTVILRTARPLDHPGLRGSVSLGAKWDSTRDKATPDMSAFISGTNDDNTFGILASIDYYKRDSRFTDVNTSGWFKQPTQNSDGTPALRNATLNGVTPGPNTNIYLPRTLNLTSTDSSRERIGGTVSIDWKVTDNLRIGIDGLYTQFKVQSKTNQLGWFTDPGSITSANVNENGTVTDFTWNGGVKSDNIVSTSPTNAKTYQIGINAKWTPAERTSLEFDLSHSNARNRVNQLFDVIGEPNTGSTPTFNLNEGGIPTMTGFLPTDDPNRAYFHCCSERGGGVRDDIWQARIDGKQDFDMGVFSSLQFGVLGTRRKKSILAVVSPEPLGGFYGGYYAKADPSLFTTFSPGSILGSPALSWLNYDHDALVRAYGSDAAINQNSSQAARDAYRAVYNALGGTPPVYDARGSGSVRELTGAAYLQANFKGDIGSHDWNAVAGVRYVYTDEFAQGNSSQLIGINFNPANPTGATADFTPTIPVSAKSHYGEWLPSATFRFNWSDSLDFRAAISRTMTRPTLSQLTLAENYNFRPPNQSTLSGGNPFLKPYFAWNYDLGVNYYLGRTSYLSVAGFYKDISNFVSSVTTRQVFFGLPFDVTRPTNANSSKVYGFEATAQFTFENLLPAPFDGLGVSANYTKVKSSTSFDPALSSQVFNVEGLSDSANAVVFYEKGPIQVRAAYNWRAPFLRSTFGDNSQPSNIDKYEQVDLSSSLQVIKNAAIFVQVLNLFNEKQRSYSAFKERFSGLYETGRIVTAGVRATF